MSDIIPRRPEGVGVSPGLGTVLAPVIYLLLLAAGTTVLSIVFSGMRQPDWMSRDPSGWFWGAHRQALDMGVGLAISVLPSITHTYQIVDWLSGEWRWRAWPMALAMIAAPVGAFAWTQQNHPGTPGLIVCGVFAAATAMFVFGLPRKPKAD